VNKFRQDDYYKNIKERQGVFGQLAQMSYSVLDEESKEELEKQRLLKELENKFKEFLKKAGRQPALVARKIYDSDFKIPTPTPQNPDPKWPRQPLMPAGIIFGRSTEESLSKTISGLKTKDADQIKAVIRRVDSLLNSSKLEKYYPSKDIEISQGPIPDDNDVLNQLADFMDMISQWKGWPDWRVIEIILSIPDWIEYSLMLKIKKSLPPNATRQDFIKALRKNKVIINPKTLAKYFFKKVGFTGSKITTMIKQGMRSTVKMIKFLSTLRGFCSALGILAVSAKIYDIISKQKNGFYEAVPQLFIIDSINVIALAFTFPQLVALTNFAAPAVFALAIGTELTTSWMSGSIEDIVKDVDVALANLDKRTNKTNDPVEKLKIWEKYNPSMFKILESVRNALCDDVGKNVYPTNMHILYSKDEKPQWAELLLKYWPWLGDKDSKELHLFDNYMMVYRAATKTKTFCGEIKS
jgi:hypothetical protein